MALRTTVSRIAARGTVTTPPAESNPLDNLRPDVPPADADDIGDGSSERADAAPADAHANTAASPTPAPARRGRPPVDRARTKKVLQVVPAVTGKESVPELRSKIKEVEQAIKEARARHDEEMKALKSVYAELHARMFDHVK